MNSIRHDLFGFENTPFFKPCKKPFLDQHRKKAQTDLKTFLNYTGFAAIAGPQGSGKSTLVKSHLQELNPSAHKIIYLPFVKFSDSDLLRYISTSFGLEPAFRKSKAIQQLQEYINKLQAIKTVIVFDDIQNASPATLELIRLLGDNCQKMSCIMIGTPPFFDQLKLRINKSLRQRITYFLSMQNLDEQGTESFISHCLKDAGCSREIFSSQAIKYLYDIAKGCLRITANLAGQALVQASLLEQSQVDLEQIQQAEKVTMLPKMEFTS